MEDGRIGLAGNTDLSRRQGCPVNLSRIDINNAVTDEGRLLNSFPIVANSHLYRSSPLMECNGGNLLPEEKLEHEEYQRQWNNTLHTDPGIQYVGMSAASPINRLYMTTSRMLKRKMEASDSSMSPSRKQHITEEKMAACMQGLRLEDEQIRRPVKNVNNDSDFEDDSDIEDEEIEEQSIDPVFELHVDLKDHLRKLTTIVPGSVIDEMRKTENMNLAIVPYVPLDSLFLKSIRNSDDKVEEGGELDCNDTEGKYTSSNDLLVNDMMFE